MFKCFLLIFVVFIKALEMCVHIHKIQTKNKTVLQKAECLLRKSLTRKRLRILVDFGNIDIRSSISWNWRKRECEQKKKFDSIFVELIRYRCRLIWISTEIITWSLMIDAYFRFRSDGVSMENMHFRQSNADVDVRNNVLVQFAKCRKWGEWVRQSPGIRMAFVHSRWTMVIGTQLIPFRYWNVQYGPFEIHTLD